MLELICQQRYVNGASVDHTVYRNHGVPIGIPKPPTPNIIGFPNPDSRVAIGLGSLHAWSPLVALKIEIDARLQRAAEPGLKLGLVHGDGSFVFYLNSVEDGSSVLVTQIAGPPFVTDLRAVGATTPLNRWVTFGLFHDGYSRLQLLIDGKIVGQVNVVGGVPPVQAGGVAIGNLVGGGSPFLNEVREVRIWRLDPNAMKREFLCRPQDAATAACWEAIFRTGQEWRRDHPAAAQALIQQLQMQQRELIRGIFPLPESEQAEARAIVDELIRLWCHGHIDHAHMRDALRRWIGFLRRHGLDPGANAELESLKRRYGLHFNLDCDPKALAFLRILEQESQSST